MLYKNCRELPYHNFNEVQVTGDLTYLIKDNEEHEEKELSDHWVDIVEEYLILSDSYEQKKFFRDKAQLKSLEVKLNVLISLKKLNEYNLTEEHKSKIELIKRRYRVTDLERDILGTQDDIKIKIKQFKESFEEKETVSYEEVLSSLRVNGINVNRKELTVSEYVSLLKELKKKSSKKEK